MRATLPTDPSPVDRARWWFPSEKGLARLPCSQGSAILKVRAAARLSRTTVAEMAAQSGMFPDGRRTQR